MKSKLFFLVALAVGMVFVMSGCKDDECFDETNPECSNFDPCFGKYPEKLEIEMRITDPRDLNVYIPTFDSVFTINSNLYFYTNFDYDSVLWQIGADPTIWNRKSLPLRFEKEALNSTVTITARCFRPIDQKCLGVKDDGIDILSRTISFGAHEDSPLHGIWRGTNNGEKDSFDVEIERVYAVGQFGDTVYNGSRLTGIPKGTQTPIGKANMRINWFSFVYGYRDQNDANGLLKGSVSGRIQENGNIQINWKIYQDDRLRIFTGKKIK
jgi:hypothetical protein